MRKVIVSAVAAASALTAFKPVRGSSWESCLDLGRQHERQPMIKSAIAGLALSAVLANGAHAQFPGGPMDQFSAMFFFKNTANNEIYTGYDARTRERSTRSADDFIIG